MYLNDDGRSTRCYNAPAMSINSRSVIKEAWRFTLQNKRLVFWYGLIPSIFSILGGIAIWGYQFFALKRSPLWEDAETSFLYELLRRIFDLADRYSDMLAPGIVGVIIFAIGYFLLPTLLQGGLIQLIARIRNGQEVKLIDGLGYGFLVFLPLIEYNALTGTLSWSGMFVEATFVLRNFGTEVFRLIVPVFIVATVVGFVMAFLFTYTQFYLVIDRKGVFAAIGNSVRLVVLHWQQTLLMLILMLLIGVRIVVNVLFVLAVPIVIVALAEYFFSLAMVKVAIVVGSALGLVALYFSAWFSGILEVFSNAVWTFTFLELTSEKELPKRELEGARIIEGHQPEEPRETSADDDPGPHRGLV